MELEIMGIKVEVTSNYLTKSYQNDSISIKKHLLSKWEEIHKEIFKNKKKKKIQLLRISFINQFQN